MASDVDHIEHDGGMKHRVVAAVEIVRGRTSAAEVWLSRRGGLLVRLRGPETWMAREGSLAFAIKEWRKLVQIGFLRNFGKLIMDQDGVLLRQNYSSSRAEIVEAASPSHSKTTAVIMGWALIAMGQASWFSQECLVLIYSEGD